MIPKTPRGFRDVLPTEAAWRQSVTGAIRERIALWGYLPVETPTVELLDVLQKPGELSDTPFQFFDSDNNLLVLRPDVTLPVARMTALRLSRTPGPFRLTYDHKVFRDQAATYGDERQFTQIGIEAIGIDGVVADAEVVCLLFEALEAAGLSEFTVAIGTVGVLNALVAAAKGSEKWGSDVFEAFHRSDFVALDSLTASDDIDSTVGSAISQLARIRGGQEAIEECRALVEPLGCVDGLDELAETCKLVNANVCAGRLLVDFSIISSFDYYTGMVFKAYAPQLPKSLASGGRYNSTLEAFGRKEPAAGWALGLERILQALEAQGIQPNSLEPDAVVFDEDPQKMFEKAAQLRKQGKRVVFGGAC